MSMRYILKDLTHNKGRSLSYSKYTGLLIGLVIFYLNFGRSLGLTNIAGAPKIYNLTLIVMFSQYNSFIINGLFLFVIAYVLFHNHALIAEKKNDIAVMKAVGALYKKIGGFILGQCLYLVITSYIMGVIYGFSLYLLIFIILDSTADLLIWNPAVLQSLVLFIAVVFFTFVVNGAELTYLVKKPFSKLRSGGIEELSSYDRKRIARSSLRKKSIPIRMVLRSFIRNRSKIRKRIGPIVIAGIVVIAGLTGLMVFKNNADRYISGAQFGDDAVIMIASAPVADVYFKGYESFSNNSIGSPVMKDLTFSYYNTTPLVSDIRSYMETLGVNNSYEYSIEPRLLTINYIREQQGYEIVKETGLDGSSSTYKTLGTNDRYARVPVIGYSSGDVFHEFLHEGNPDDPYRIAIVGDSLAGTLFEEPLNQSVLVYNPTNTSTGRYQISAVVCDTFNNGMVLYLPIEDLNDLMNLTDYSNILLVRIGDIPEGFTIGQIVDGLKDVIGHSGNDLIVMPLNDVFNDNRYALLPQIIISYLVIIVMGIFIAASLYGYEVGRINADKREFSIMRALGCRRCDMERTLFLEQIAIATVSLLIAFIVSMFIVLFFLIPSPLLPPFYVPIIIFMAVWLIIVIFLRSATRRVVGKIYGASDIFV